MRRSVRCFLFLLLLIGAVASAQYAPAPFRLSEAGHTNPTLFRLDHTSRLPGCVAGQGLERDTLRLQWRPSVWTGADTGRNNPTDPVRYEWNVIVDTSAAQRDSARTGITYTFPSWNNGTAAELRLSGDVFYPTLFTPSPWPAEEPDSIVMRVRWFVRAYNSVGSVFSDTAGHTVHRGSDSSMLTPALMLSYNRLSFYRSSQLPQQYWKDILPIPVEPADSGVVAVDGTGMGHIIWTPGYDRNIVAGIDIGGFRRYFRATRRYHEDPSGRTVDTLQYQWVGTVVRTVPPGHGAAPGTRLVLNTGTTQGLQLTKQKTDSLLGIRGSGGADSVVIEWQVFVKDAEWTDNVPIERIPFPYEADGTLRADTGLWSRFGCRPHVVASKVFHATLARQRWAPAPFVLSNAQTTSTTLFRIDHVGPNPPCGDFLADSLRLRWVKSEWTGAESGRNDPFDTVRYEWHALVDSGGTDITRAVHVSAPSSRNGRDPRIVLGGAWLVQNIFRPATWPASQPDSIVRRVRWYVRAYNSAGSTYSDTAGWTRHRVNPLPTPALLVSYNRLPDKDVTVLRPLDNTVIIGLTASHPAIPIQWTDADDPNIRAGRRIGGFKLFDVARRAWIDDPSKRTVDTLFYQWIAEVIDTKPTGRGAPLGTIFVQHTGTWLACELTNPQTTTMFGSYDNNSPIAADTVVLRWRVDTKDFWSNDDLPYDEVQFRYNIDGTLRSDTGRWSQFGCQPHVLMGAWNRLTLVRNTTMAAGAAPEADGYLLGQNYPNPFTHNTRFTYTLPHAGSARLTISDLLGRELVQLRDGTHAAGTHAVTWDGRDAAGRRVPAGQYFIRLMTWEGVRERILMKQ
ncbi:MAG: T9SS type A sorting domain-containing protein [Ignavibacteriae bacterium]|nr:T9SS type A sorting domain-containing protein [Ignavibacteriota bacterium]